MVSRHVHCLVDGCPKVVAHMENRTHYPRFSELFKNTQRSLEITDQQMARHLGVNLSTVRRFQAGERAPDEVNLVLIAAAFTAHRANRPLREAGDERAERVERADRAEQLALYFWTIHRKLVMAKTSDIAARRVTRREPGTGQA